MAPTGRERFDRGSLEHYLRGLLENDRPVRCQEAKVRIRWNAIDGSVVLGLLLTSGILWLLWVSFVR